MSQVIVICLILADVSLVLVVAAAANSDVKPEISIPEVLRMSRKVLEDPIKVVMVDEKMFLAPGEEPAMSPVTEMMEIYIKKHHQHHHRSADKSIVGGGVIIGVLVTMFVVAVFCYIRATRRRKIVEPSA